MSLQTELNNALARREKMQMAHMNKYRNGSATRAQTTTFNANVTRLNETIIELRAQIKEEIKNGKSPK